MSEAEDLVGQRYGVEIAVDPQINETLRTILGHRTCRRFADQPISDATLTLLLACAQSAPSKSNLQQYSIINVVDSAVRQAVAELVPSMPWLATAPRVLVFLGDVRRIRELARLRNHTYRNNNADTFMNAAVDAALAMQNLMTAAESIGIGSCPISYLRNRIDELAHLLHLPDGVFPVCGLTLGYRDDAAITAVRLPPSVVIHQDRYDDGQLADEISEYDARAHDRSPLPPENQRHTERYGVLEKCPWSENVTRQLSLPERAGFARFLKEKDIRLD